MPWVFRGAEQHRCKLPIPLPVDARHGDLWECDDPSCLKVYMVHTGRFDLYLEHAPQHEKPKHRPRS